MDPDYLAIETKSMRAMKKILKAAHKAGYTIKFIKGHWWSFVPNGPHHWTAVTCTKKIGDLHKATLDAIKRQNA